MSWLGFLLLRWITMTNDHAGEERVLWVTSPDHSSSLEEVRKETQTQLDMLHISCSAHFLVKPKSTSPGMVPPSLGWIFPILITNWEENAWQLDLREVFPQLSPSSLMTWTCVKLTQNQQAERANQLTAHLHGFCISSSLGFPQWTVIQDMKIKQTLSCLSCFESWCFHHSNHKSN